MKKEKDVKRNILKEIKNMATEEYSKEEVEKLSKELEWIYKYKDSTLLPTKTSVSRLKEASLENDKQTTNIFEELNKNKFLRDEKITKAQIGTLVHMCIQRLDESKEYTLKDIQNFINELIIKEIITEKEAESIDENLLYKYTQSNIFKDLKRAKKVYKEQAFYINIPSKEIYNNIDSEDNILVQGVIDLYFIDKNENIILVDYKTDYVANGKEYEIINKYKKQIEIYKRALENATGRKVYKSYLCLANREWNCYEVNVDYSI